MEYIGEKSVSSEVVMTECPYCGSLQKKTIHTFKSDIDNDCENSQVFLCFHCKKLYVRYANGKCEKLSK